MILQGIGTLELGFEHVCRSLTILYSTYGLGNTCRPYWKKASLSPLPLPPVRFLCRSRVGPNRRLLASYVVEVLSSGWLCKYCCPGSVNLPKYSIMMLISLQLLVA
jgi:hypothetical protein